MVTWETRLNYNCSVPEIHIAKLSNLEVKSSHLPYNFSTYP